MNKLQNVLNDEESMKQIKELAGMLGNEMGSSSAESQPQSQPLQQDNSQPDFSQLIANLGSMMNSGNDSVSPPSSIDSPNNSGSANGLDMQKIMQLGTIISQANKSDKNVDLLLALKPLLKEENQLKIDRLIKIFKLFAVYPALKESGLLGGDLFGLL